jgi:hypothetical protein
LREWVRNRTDARTKTTKVYMDNNARFFPFRLRREESVKSRMFFCRSIQVFISLFQLFGWQKNGAGREMFERQRRILESGVSIGLGDMPRIVGFREEAEVCQSEVPNHSLFLLKEHLIGLDLIRRVNQKEGREGSEGENKEKEFFRFAHGFQSRVLTRAGVTSLNFTAGFPL